MAISVTGRCSMPLPRYCPAWNVFRPSFSSV
jgi:hypothetical protein